MAKKRFDINTPAPSAADGMSSFKDFILAKLAPKFAKQGATIGSGDELAHLHEPTGYVPTGMYGLDAILSRGKGLPHGRFIEVFAPESAGKSALAEYLMGRVKAQKGTLHHLDTEHTRDDDHLACYGISPGDFIDGSDLPDLESVWDYARGVVTAIEERNAERKKLKVGVEPVNLIVLDSLAATPSRDELNEDSHADRHVGLQARSNSKGVRVTLRAFSASSAIFLFINQIRDKIGAVGYGPKTDTPGGRALKFAYSIRLKLAKVETLKKGDVAIGHVIEVQTVKNKFAPPQMKTKIVLSYARGIDPHWSNFLYFQEHGYIVAKGGRGFVWKGQEESFKRTTFPEWCKSNRKLLTDAATACHAKDFAAISDPADAEIDS